METGDELLPDPAFLAPLAMPVVRRRLNTAPLPFPLGTAIVCRITETIHESDVVDPRYSGKAQVCVVEAPNGEQRLMFVGKVLASTLIRSYPDAGYVDRWFHITKLPALKKDRYAEYEVAEIEPPGQGPDLIAAG